MRNYIITIYCYDGLLECIYQGDIYGPMMSTVVYVVYIVFTLFPDVGSNVPGHRPQFARHRPSFTTAVVPSAITGTGSFRF